MQVGWQYAARVDAVCYQTLPHNRGLVGRVAQIPHMVIRCWIISSIL